MSNNKPGKPMFNITPDGVHVTNTPTYHIDGIPDSKAFLDEHYGPGFQLPGGVHTLVYRTFGVELSASNPTFRLSV
jgi:hypothetical protein